ncbi:hypothetical protein P8452_65645 [Trifolium repens]|nr:hypothetical protein P8452_65645 [Trifolium repens]
MQGLPEDVDEKQSQRKLPKKTTSAYKTTTPWWLYRRRTAKNTQTIARTVLSSHKITNVRPRKHPKPTRSYTEPLQQSTSSERKETLSPPHRATLRPPPKLRNSQNKTSTSTTKLHSMKEVSPESRPTIHHLWPKQNPAPLFDLLPPTPLSDPLPPTPHHN